MGKPTGNICPITERADSKHRLRALLDSNLFEKYLDFSHLHFQKMESYTKNTGNSSDGESNASLSEILWELASYGSETAVSENNSVKWSEEAFFYESDTEAGAALKVAAQPVEQMEAHVGINSQKSAEQKLKGDKFQQEITQVNKVEFSVLKVTEKLKIC